MGLSGTKNPDVFWRLFDARKHPWLPTGYLLGRETRNEVVAFAGFKRVRVPAKTPLYISSAGTPIVLKLIGGEFTKAIRLLI